MNNLNDPRKILASLFDPSFSEFITVRIINVIFIISIVFSAICSFNFLLAGLASRSVLVGLGAVIISPILFILYVLAARVLLELILVIFRIAENTSALRKEKKSRESEEE